MKCYFGNCLIDYNNELFVFNDRVSVCHYHLPFVHLEPIFLNDSCVVCEDRAVVKLKETNWKENVCFCDKHFELWKETEGEFKKTYMKIKKKKF